MKKLNYKSKKNVRISKENWKIVENTHEPIIDKNTFIKVNEIINSRQQTRIKKHDYLLKGIVHCYECKRKMGCICQKLKNGDAYYFRCNSHIRFNNCSPHSIKMQSIEKIILDKLNYLIKNNITNDDIIKIANEKYKQYIKNNSIKIDIEKYNNELFKLSCEIDKLYEDKLNNIISEEDFSRIYKNKLKEKNDINKKIKSLNSNKSIITQEKFIHELINTPIIITREILLDFIEKIEIDKNKNVYVYFKFKTLN